MDLLRRPTTFVTFVAAGLAACSQGSSSAVPDASRDAAPGPGAPDAAPFAPTPSEDAGSDAPFDAPIQPFEAGICFGGIEAGADGGCGCVDLSTDPHNCGQCGHDCSGGACQAGACIPLPAGVLATGQHEPIAIAVDSSNVYWLNLGYLVGPGGKLGFYYEGGQVMKCAIGGCGNSPTVLGSGWTQAALYPTPSGLTLDARSVYWLGGGNVLSCAISGCTGQPITRVNGAEASGMTVTSSGFYTTEYGIGEIAFCPLSGCAGGPANFATTVSGPEGITHDATEVYWVDVNGVLGGCPLGGCVDAAATALITPTAAGSRALAVDDTNLYWTNGNPAGVGSVEQCNKTDCATTAMTLASGRTGPMGIAVDASNVYWVEGDSVYKCAIGGCGNSPTRVAAATGQAIAIDATHLYVSQGAPGLPDGGYDPLDQYVVALPK